MIGLFIEGIDPENELYKSYRDYKPYQGAKDFIEQIWQS
jgi:hypothetical protein